jgi:two-component system alkaline phosphatase synthesis response regulator PhoP
MRILIRYNLNLQGYETIHYQSGETFLQHRIPENTGLLIISVQLSDVDGTKLCELIRNQGIHTPILFLTTSWEEEQCDCIENLAVLKKPFSVSDLVNKTRELWQA